MQAAEFRRRDVSGLGGNKADHHIGLILPQADHVPGTLEVALNFGKLGMKPSQLRGSKERIQPVGDANSYNTLGLLLLGTQVVGQRK